MNYKHLPKEELDDSILKYRLCGKCLEVYLFCCCGSGPASHFCDSEEINEESKKSSKGVKGKYLDTHLSESNLPPHYHGKDRKEQSGKVRKHYHKECSTKHLESSPGQSAHHSTKYSDKDTQDRSTNSVKASHSNWSNIPLIASDSEGEVEDLDWEIFQSSHSLQLKSNKAKKSKTLQDNLEAKEIDQQENLLVPTTSAKDPVMLEDVEVESKKDQVHEERGEIQLKEIKLLQYGSDNISKQQGKDNTLQKEELVFSEEFELQHQHSKEHVQDQKLHQEIISQSKSLAELKAAVCRHEEKIQVFQQQIKDFHSRELALSCTEGQRDWFLRHEEHAKELSDCKNLVREHSKKFLDLEEKIESTYKKQETSNTRFLHRIEGLEEFLQQFCDSEKTFIIRHFGNRRSRWRSPGMYSEHGGFKFCIEVMPSSQDLKFFLTSMEGLYDDDLDWPISVTFVLKVINQKGQDNWKGVFSGDIGVHSSYEVTSIPYKDIEQFLKKDAMYIVTSQMKQ